MISGVLVRDMIEPATRVPSVRLMICSMSDDTASRLVTVPLRQGIEAGCPGRVPFRA